MQLKIHIQDVLQKIPDQAESLKSLMKKENERYQKTCIQFFKGLPNS